MAKPQIRPASPVRMLIADDHEIFRAGLRKLLESEPGIDVVAEATNGAEAVTLVRQLSPDFVLLDLLMPQMTGLEVMRDLAAGSCASRVVLLAAAVDKAQTIEALQLGVRGVVLKDSASTLLFKCVRTVMNGELWIGREAVGDIVQQLRQAPRMQAPAARRNFGLTPREKQVIGAVVAGCANKEIAQQFSISEDTVKHHLSSVFDRLGVSNRLELALFAIHHQLVSSD